MSEPALLTIEGIKHLEAELEELKTVRRQEVAERIKQAIAFGDISENAEYNEAKNEQAFIEGKIMNIENTLRVARVVDEDDINTDSVNIGTSVKVLDLDENEEDEYLIVGSAEADAMHNKISNESPIGAALLGNPVGAEVVAQTPGGQMRLKILEIHK